MKPLSHRFRILILPIVAVLSVLTTGCGRGKTSVTLAGSTAFQPFAEKLAERYMLIHPEIGVTVQGGGSAVGIQSALSGAADIGMADLVRLPAEAAELQPVTVARDGIVIVVHPSNPLSGLTMDQTRGLFCGKIRNWNELGGPDAAVTVVSREAGSGTRTSFEQIVGDIKLTGDAIIQDSNGTIRETVANDASAVGYLSHGLLSEKIKALQVDGADCTTEAIQAGRYPLVRPIFLLTRGAPTGASAAFIEYVRSPDAQKVIGESGLIPAIQ
ncbi:phosphate ABC transporter substrate-binding protein [bacterium]|nr:phosphate ABC transporter substrate-binding protein [bacterium]